MNINTINIGHIFLLQIIFLFYFSSNFYIAVTLLSIPFIRLKFNKNIFRIIFIFFLLIASFTLNEYFILKSGINSIKALPFYFASIITLITASNIKIHKEKYLCFLVILFFFHDIFYTIFHISSLESFTNSYGQLFDYGPFKNPLVYIERLTFCLILFLYFFISKEIRYNFFWVLFSSIIFIVGLIISQRTLFLSPLIFVFLSLITQKNKTILIIFFIFLLFYILSYFIDGKFSLILNRFINISADSRVLILIQSVKSVPYYFFGGFQIYLPASGEIYWAHNFFLDMAKKGGWISLFLSLLFVFLLLKESIRLKIFSLVFSLMILIQTIIFPDGNYLILIVIILVYIFLHKESDQKKIPNEFNY